MRPTSFITMLGLLLSACAAETSFQNTNDEGEFEQGNGELSHTPEVVEFAELQEAVTTSAMLKISSVGENNLVIYEIRILDSGGGVFYMEEAEDVSLAPGTSREFPVTATMTDWAAEATGTVRVKTNDPEAIALEIGCSATPAPDWGAPDTGE